MLTRTVVSPLLDACCYLRADGSGRAVVVDPGLGVAEGVRDIVAAEGLDVVAVLVTHGHVDHTWDAAQVCDDHGVDLWVHADDAYRIVDPFGSLGPLGPQLEQLARSAGQAYREPSRVRTFTAVDGDVRLPVADRLDVDGLHVPGHTEGSTVYRWTEDDVALTGDVLFAGTIGRTDLPGGDPEAMRRSLARLAALPPSTAVLPGHGTASTIAAELATNPFLRAV